MCTRLDTVACELVNAELEEVNDVGTSNVAESVEAGTSSLKETEPSVAALKGVGDMESMGESDGDGDEDIGGEDEELEVGVIPDDASNVPALEGKVFSAFSSAICWVGYILLRGGLGRHV